MDELFQGLFTATTDIGIGDFLISIGVAVAMGIALALVHSYKSSCTKSFAVTLAMLPAVVAIVIMMVSGSIGAGVAVAGTFSLVRFRSVPGSAREIGAIFLAMAVGLACGMGYPVYAVIFTVIMSAVNIILTVTGFGEGKNNKLCKTLRITVPEDLEYYGMFDEIFDKYTDKAEMTGVKTTNLGSLNRLTYNVILKKKGVEKQLIDDLRIRNGNLEINLTAGNSDTAPQQL